MRCPSDVQTISSVQDHLNAKHGLGTSFRDIKSISLRNFHLTEMNVENCAVVNLQQVSFTCFCSEKS